MKKRIIFPERQLDKRVAEAARTIENKGIAKIVSEEKAQNEHKTAINGYLNEKLPIRSGGKEVGSLTESLALLALGEADILISGAVTETGEVIKNALKIIGTNESNGLVSSYFKMLNPDGGVYFFADCAVVPTPDASQLCQIAKDTAKEALRQGIEPRVAILSYSTHSKDIKPPTALQKETIRMLKADTDVDFVFDGEIQFDAASDPSVAQTKCPDSPFAQEAANVFIFPNLDSGNVAYKVARHYGCTAIGPVLQGFAKPVHDLSRSCSASDIIELAKLVA